MSILTDVPSGVTFQNAAPSWATRTELDDDYAMSAYDPTAPVGQYVAADYAADQIAVRAEQQFRLDGSFLSEPHVYAYVTTDSLTAEQARALAAALLKAAQVLDQT